MQQLDFLDDNTSDTVFRDLIMLTLAGFIVVTFILLPHISPKAKATAEVNSPGNVIVELRWPDEVDADVDLWVAAPTDKPVGYSNQSAKVFNLLRDDVGVNNDLSGINYEVAYSRGIPAGEYAVNVHFFSDRTYAAPVEAQITVSLKKDTKRSAKRILTKNVSLKRLGQELTVIRFRMNEAAELERASINDLPVSLRSQSA